MTELMPSPAVGMERLIELTLATCVSHNTRRMYATQLRRFIASGSPLNREGVALYLQAQRNTGNGPATITSVVSAIRKFATEAQVRGLITREELDQITSISPGKQYRTRQGLWLTLEQVREFIALPDRGTWWGRRDAAIIAVMVGCGLRRAEMATLKWSNYQSREKRMCFVDFVGKGNKLRTIPVPLWAQPDVDKWFFLVQETPDEKVPSPSGIRSLPTGPFDRTLVAGGIEHDRIYSLLRDYARKMGLELAPHDLRRSLARLMRDTGAPLEQIQYTLGHEDINTTMRYLGSNLKLGPGVASVDQIALGVEDA